MMNIHTNQRIIIIYLAYGKNHIHEGLSRLSTIADNMFPNASRHCVVVDNASNEFISNDAPIEYTSIPGDNTLFEFSGWDKGYEYARSNLSLAKNDIIFFANDTFFRRNYRDGGLGYLDFFNRHALKDQEFAQSAIGYLDDFPCDVKLMGITYNSWIRSNIFLLPHNIVQRLRSLCIPINDNEIFATDPRVFWSDTDKISKNLKAYLSSWMFGIENPDYPEYRLHWLNAQLPDDKNFQFFKTKTKCILSEHHLTARLYDWNIPIINTNKYELIPDRHIAPYYV